MRSPATLIPTVPEPVRAVLRSGVWAYGTVTSPFRPLPDFLVLGAQKAGTTALYTYLRRHPDLAGPSWKEVSFFDRHWVRGVKWYRGNFPNKARTRDKLVGEASPSYVFHPLGPERVQEIVPGARLVVLVRNPVDRALFGTLPRYQATPRTQWRSKKLTSVHDGPVRSGCRRRYV